MFDNIQGSPGLNHKRTWLDTVPGLQYITEAVWEEALNASEMLAFPAGTKLAECGDTVTQFVIVLHGVIRVYQTADTGREICLYRARSGEVCMLTLAKLLRVKNVCSQAVAEEDVRILAMPLAYFHRLMNESCDFRNFVICSMATCLTNMMQMVGNVSFDRLEMRLACLIVELTQLHASSTLKITHQEIANQLGTTREVVSRLLKDFEHLGYVKLGRRSIEVISEERLQHISSQGASR